MEVPGRNPSSPGSARKQSVADVVSQKFQLTESSIISSSRPADICKENSDPVEQAALFFLSSQPLSDQARYRLRMQFNRTESS